MKVLQRGEITMKKYLLTTIAGVALVSAAGFGLSAVAEQTNPAEEHTPVTAPDTPPASNATTMPMMHKMRQQMAKIHETMDPEERQRLMAEHMKNMQAMMSKMSDEPMMGCAFQRW